MINPTDLRYFLELSKTLNFTRAAERLGISQPALSLSLRRIEAEIKTELLHRSKKKVQLTEAGQNLVQKSDQFLKLWDEVLISVHQSTTESKGTIRLGCHTAVAQYALPEFLGSFLSKNPEVQIKLSHDLSRKLTEQVVSEQIDVALAINPQENPDLIIKELGKDRVMIWQSKNCKNPEVLFVEPELLQTQSILKKLKKQGTRFTRIIESSSLEVIANLVSHGVGCGILPERVLKSFEFGKYEPVKDSPIFHDRLCLIYKPPFRQLARGRAFIETAAKNIERTIN